MGKKGAALEEVLKAAVYSSNIGKVKVNLAM